MALLSLVEVEDLSCERGGRRIFRGLSFAVAAGMALTLEGPNGAGKTSVLRIISGLLNQEIGEVRIHAGAGYVVSDPEERGRLAGWIGHHDGAKGQLTVIDNARFFASLYGSRVDLVSVLDRVGLKRLADVPAQYLSAGQRKRLGLARLILSGRALWLLDEPLSSLDAAGRRLTAELIGQHCDDGGIAIVATHETLGLDATRFFIGNT
ncbi:MAG: heme ABC exporter ATP-binding protein CcmA [Alphaproteobacteria bacterium]|nr:heme ABC exporter ATP-binding protein CcmA [Alphaproteobacteria bacterium]